MLKLLLFFVTLSVAAAPNVYIPQQGFNDNFWQQVQIQNVLSQQQLQAQDQYRRQLLLQDQQRQIQQISDQQLQIQSTQGSLQMHQYSDRLKLYSSPINRRQDVVKKKKR